jgi:hypothetical protein
MSSIVLWLLIAQSQRPLPNPELFLQATRSQLILQLDEHELLKGYVYRRKTTREKLGRDGMAKDGQVVEHDIFEFNDGPQEKLISRNGVPLAEPNPEKQDDQENKENWKKNESGPPFAPKSRQDREAMIDDMFRVWNFQMVRREFIAGRPALLIAFGPKKDAKPQTLAGKWMFKNSEGVAWVDEADHRIVRMRTVLIKDVTLGWGLVAKVHKGTEIIREWRKINNEVWLPSWSQKRLRARAFMMMGSNLREIEEYTDYRKFNSETKLDFVSPN